MKSEVFRQAEYKARKIANGYKRVSVWLHKSSLEFGFDAGFSGVPITAVPIDSDRMSWLFGWAQGEAERARKEIV